MASATPSSGGDQNPTEKPSRIVPGAPQTLANISDEPRNVLVGGVDRRPEANSEVEGSRMDTMMLVRVYPDTGEIRIVSIPRDFLVEIGPSVETKINAAYSYGGASGAIRAVEDFSNVDVDHYIVVDFAGFEALVDAIGGLRIDVEEGQVPPHWKVKDGIQRLSGRKALSTPGTATLLGETWTVSGASKKRWPLSVARLSGGNRRRGSPRSPAR